MELALRGRIALVTGASEGIGRAIGEALAAEGVPPGILIYTIKPGAVRAAGCT